MALYAIHIFCRQSGRDCRMVEKASAGRLAQNCVLRDPVRGGVYRSGRCHGGRYLSNRKIRTRRCCLRLGNSGRFRCRAAGVYARPALFFSLLRSERHSHSTAICRDPGGTDNGPRIPCGASTARPAWCGREVGRRRIDCFSGSQRMDRIRAAATRAQSANRIRPGGRAIPAALVGRGYRGGRSGVGHQINVASDDRARHFRHPHTGAFWMSIGNNLMLCEPEPI